MSNIIIMIPLVSRQLLIEHFTMNIIKSGLVLTVTIKLPVLLWLTQTGTKKYRVLTGASYTNGSKLSGYCTTGSLVLFGDYQYGGYHRLGKGVFTT